MVEISLSLAARTCQRCSHARSLGATALLCATAGASPPAVRGWLTLSVRYASRALLTLLPSSPHSMPGDFGFGAQPQLLCTTRGSASDPLGSSQTRCTWARKTRRSWSGTATRS